MIQTHRLLSPKSRSMQEKINYKEHLKEEGKNLESE